MQPYAACSILKYFVYLIKIWDQLFAVVSSNSTTLGDLTLFFDGFRIHSFIMFENDENSFLYLLISNLHLASYNVGGDY